MNFLANRGYFEKKFVVCDVSSLPRKLIGIVKIDRVGLFDLRIPKM